MYPFKRSDQLSWSRLEVNCRYDLELPIKRVTQHFFPFNLAHQVSNLTRVLPNPPFLSAHRTRHPRTDFLQERQTGLPQFSLIEGKIRNFHLLTHKRPTRKITMSVGLLWTRAHLSTNSVDCYTTIGQGECVQEVFKIWRLAWGSSQTTGIPREIWRPPKSKGEKPSNQYQYETFLSNCKIINISSRQLSVKSEILR